MEDGPHGIGERINTKTDAQKIVGKRLDGEINPWRDVVGGLMASETEFTVSIPDILDINRLKDGGSLSGTN